MPDQWQPEGLAAVNALRARYGCAPLEWDAQCEYDAYNYAQTLAQRNGNLEHDKIPQEKKQAECLAMLYSNYTSGNSYVDGVRNWWDTQRNTAGDEVGPGEEDMYFNDPDRQYHFLNWGHFAILVSKQATKIGMSFGVADEDAEWAQGGKNIYVVARIYGAFGVSDPADPYKRMEHHERR